MFLIDPMPMVTQRDRRKNRIHVTNKSKFKTESGILM